MTSLVIAIFSWTMPVCVLLGWVGLNEYQLRTSQTLILPIEGYDPRDLLSGYYLTYKVHYGATCPEVKKKIRNNNIAYICFKPKKYITLKKPKDCSLFIKGQCFSKEFSANVTRYYIPEKKTRKATELFRKAHQKQVVLAVPKTGQALVRDLLVDGKSLKKQLN